MGISYTGLAVRPTRPASMQVVVEPGTLTHDKGSIEMPEPRIIGIRAAGTRKYSKQSYAISGIGTVSPGGWNGEGIRGSGGRPYQRMVPGTLQVYAKDRETLYRPEEDYIQDSYWGTVKRHPDGRIGENEILSLDYEVWLCRYDAIVLSEDGSIQVVEGDSEAPESRELLLPEPPLVQDGFVLAHVFTGWGQKVLYGGGSYVTGDPDPASLPVLGGRYEDMAERTYVVNIVGDDRPNRFNVRIGATGEDYGTNRSLTLGSLRWTDEKFPASGDKLPLAMKSAYGHEIDWGLELELPLMNAPKRLEIHAIPEMIFDMRHLLGGYNPVDAIPNEQGEHLQGFKDKLAAAQPVRIAFFGESTTRSGLWPYQVASGLRSDYPQTKIYTSNVAIGGEGTLRGIHRLEDEVLSVKPDLILLEYLINDACSGNDQAIEKTVRSILRRICGEGIACLIVTNNGMNPVFSPHGSTRNFLAYHELYRRLAAEFQVAFIGGFDYFMQLHRYGKYYLTELKGNMVNHPYGNEDLTWGPFDKVLSTAILKSLGSSVS